MAETWTDFHVTQGSAADLLNSGGRLGTNDGPIYAPSDCTVDGGSTTTITDNSVGSQWVGCQVGDWLVWDTGAAQELRRIANISSADVTVDRACTPGANKLVRVGGSCTIAGIFGRMNTYSAALWPGSVAAPRIAIKYDATPYDATAGAIDSTATWSESIPLLIAGYQTTPGDVDWLSGTVRAAVDFGSSGAYGFSNSGTYNIWRNLSITGSRSGTQTALSLDGEYSCAQNVVGEQTSAYSLTKVFSSSENYNSWVRCKAARGTGNTGFGFSVGRGALVGCESYGDGGTGFVGETYGMLLRCIAAGMTTGISIAAGHAPRILFSTTVGNAAGITYADAAAQMRALVMGCKICYNTVGLSGVAGLAALTIFNEYYGNTAKTSGLTLPGIGDVDGDAEHLPFVDYPTDLRPGANSYGVNLPLILAGGGDALTSHETLGALGKLIEASSGAYSYMT